MAEDPIVHPETAPDSVWTYEPWSWREPSHGEHFRTCSFCGSIHPADLAAETAWQAGWADQKYGWPHKFYVDIVNRNPDRLYCIGTQNGGDGPRGPGWVAVGDLTEEQRGIIDRDRMGGDRLVAALFSTRPKHHAKFYTIHLSDPAVDRAVIDEIERRSGRHFTFGADGRVSWGPPEARV